MFSDRVGYFIFGVATAVAIGGTMLYFRSPRKPVEEAKSEPEKSRSPATFNELGFAAIEPTGDGGAYAHSDTGFGTGIWYLRGAEAVRVKEVPKFTNNGSSPPIIPSLLPVLQHKVRQQKKEIDSLQSYRDEFWESQRLKGDGDE